MAKLLIFNKLGNEVPVLINKDLIRAIFPLDDGGAEILFDQEHKVEVAQEFSQVLKIINAE